ncbi:TonB-dependent receptor [Chryseobacterium nematophagum]|uniref:TonB-dependent receptor n=1 Tax=Chryseobacterium nematophagum TaxID=2305228 RepID=A0A3M7LE47_9FLAO|nr:TonB-dependent receptor [Chryseobacterium nematophagum]RMZ61003.1 TonB-dependent receptor [Chryseobacterium nematophagum]
MKLINQSMLTAIITLSTASVYYAQQVQDTVDTRSKDIEQVVITGVADIAKDRKTPVAVSTIKAAQIVEKLGNQEFPEILNTTPSVYATKGGGGFGDASIRIRGFGNENIAVMVNGMPVNDMETGAVYWSNWAGLSDVTSTMQVQRGLGSSKLAIPSVGGTINVLTRSADMKKQGSITLGLANNGYIKTAFSYNTGKNAKGWSTSFLMSRTAGAMYVDGTDFESYNYYFAVGFQPNEKHDFQFTFTGAPQWHNQNFSSSIETFIKYGNGIDDPNRRYNPNWGYLTDADGKARQFSTNRNFYSKPIASFNWDYKISESSKLSTVLYGSWGRGGGTGILGSINGKNTNYGQLPRTADGLIRWDDIVKWNQGGNVADFGANNAFPAGAGINRSNNGITQRANINSHDWYGVLSNFNHKLNQNWNFSVGIDARYYYGYHPGVLTNLLGANGYQERGDANQPNGYIATSTQDTVPSANPFVKAIKDKSQIVNRNYDGRVLWYGGFGQIEYSNDNLSAFVQGAVSNQSFQRIDNWIIDGVTRQPNTPAGEVVNRRTPYKDLLGFNIKGGINYNINANHNVFGNIGYYSRQPFFNGVFPSNRQVLNPNLTNEKIFGAELGYGYRSTNFKANVNLFRTSWGDRFQRRTGLTVTDISGNQIQNAYAEISGITQVHYGAELELFYNVGKLLDLEGMFSWGDYKYEGNASGSVFDDNNQPITIQNGVNTATLALDKAKVGDAPQLTASLGAVLKPVKGLKINANWRFIGDLYSQINVNDFMINMTTGAVPEAAQKGTLRLPDYNLFDVGANYTFTFSNKNALTLGANIYNLLDTVYISEGRTSIYNDATNTTNYKGIDVRNQVYFGFGRTWAANITFKF